MKERLKRVPPSPGVYLLKGAKGAVVYAGKAKNLNKRLQTYFRGAASLDARKAKMVGETRDFDCVVTANELEALVLEANFIKRLKPKYNIILRDDKNYPYIKLTVQEQWPRLEVTRRIAKDGSLYFGPYVPAGAMWETLRFIRRNFPLRTCRYNLGKPFRPCIQYQMGKCLAPCAESLRTGLHHERYMEVANEVKLFLQGERTGLLSRIREDMKMLSDEMRYEEAAALRNRLNSLGKAWETQRVLSRELRDADVIGLHREAGKASLYVLFIRNGMVVGQKDFFFKRLDSAEDGELVSSFMEQFYSGSVVIPPRIILPFRRDFETQRLWLVEKRGAGVRLSGARGRTESRILNMAVDNARHAFKRHEGRDGQDNTEEALAALKELLGMEVPPKRIEAVDVSNISGSEAVGAVVVWEEGGFIKDEYRLFRIKTVPGIDDFAMIGEVLSRHFKRLSGKGGKVPGLMLIDGGRGQLGAALKAARHFPLPVDIAAIAKAKEDVEERLYLPGKEAPFQLEPFAASTRLLKLIRDEAHRFAVSYHKKLRTKRVLKSPFEEVRGIGEKRRLLLLRHFGSIGAVRKATVEEIASLKGISKRTAETLKAAVGGRL